MRYIMTAVLTLFLSSPLSALEMEDNPSTLRAGVGVASSGGASGPLVNAEFVFALGDPQWTFGAKTGVVLFDTSTLVPVLGALTYHITQVGDDDLHPFISGEVGTMIGGGDVNLYLGLTPGLRIALARDFDLNVQSQFGSLDGTFYVGPGVNLVFAI